jgi:DNA-binding HxlR family transcriptional regulator
VEQRSYNQYCATARTLDLVGERWTLLLVRELLSGPKRFADLQRNLPGLGTGLLAARLKHLEREGLARKVVLPPPFRTRAYALTEAGAELGPAVLALARWGMKWALGERRRGEVFRPGWAVLGMEAWFDGDAAADLDATYEFRMGDEVFHACVAGGTIRTFHGPAPHPDATIALPEPAMLELAAGRLTFASAIENGAASASGDRQAIRRLTRIFRAPPARDRRSAAP